MWIYDVFLIFSYAIQLPCGVIQLFFFYFVIFRSKMGNSESKSNEPTTVAAPATGEKPKCKACCACPETKKVRDAW